MSNLTETVIDVICENADCDVTEINVISGIDPHNIEMILEQWREAHSDSDICTCCKILGVPYAADREIKNRESLHRGARFLPLNVLGHSIFSPEVQQKMARSFLDASDRVSTKAICENGCGGLALHVQPKYVGIGWSAVCSIDSYDDNRTGCPKSQSRLIYTCNLGDKQAEKCVRCGMDAVWQIDFPYSTQELSAAEKYGCGGSQCLYCGWRCNLGKGYIPFIRNFMHAEISFPLWFKYVIGRYFSEIVSENFCQETLSFTAVVPDSNSSYLVDAIFRNGRPDYGQHGVGSPVVTGNGRSTIAVVPVYCTTVECGQFNKIYELSTEYDSLLFGSPDSNTRLEYLGIWYDCGGEPCPSCNILGAPFGDPFGVAKWGPLNHRIMPFHPI